MGSLGEIVRPASPMNRFITWDIPHVMNLFMGGGPHEQIHHVRHPPCDESVHELGGGPLMNRFITWGMPHVMNLFMRGPPPSS